MKFSEFSPLEREKIRFFIRSEFFIDGFQIDDQDLIDVLDNNLSAKELFEHLLGLKNGWESLYKAAIDFSLEAVELEKILNKDITFTTWTIQCSNCNWRGVESELEVNFDDIGSKPSNAIKIYCPDCGKQMKVDSDILEKIKLEE